MVKGKGGAMDVNGGIDLWKKAAAKGDALVKSEEGNRKEIPPDMDMATEMP